MFKTLVIDWLINQVFAWIARWLDQNQPTQRLHDPSPAPIVRERRYHGHPVSHWKK